MFGSDHDGPVCYDAVAKRTLVHSPIINHIFDVRVSVNKNINNYEREYNSNFSTLSDAIKEEFKLNDGFASDLFGTADTLDELFAEQDKQINNKHNNTTSYIPRLCTARVLVRNKSLLINNNVFPLPALIRSAALLPGISIVHEGKHYPNEDNIIISLSTGYLLLLRLVYVNRVFKPVLYQWNKIFDPKVDEITDRLGHVVACHKSGFYFTISAYNNYMAIFECFNTKQGTYFQKPQNIKIDGTIVHSCLLDSVNQLLDNSAFCSFALVLSDEQRLQARTFEWLKNDGSSIVSRSTLPLVNKFEIPCFVIPLRTMQSVLCVSEKLLNVITAHQVHSGGTDFLKHRYTGSFPLAYYQPERPFLYTPADGEGYAEVLISSIEGVIFLVSIIGNERIEIIPLVKVKHFVSVFTLERIDSADNLDEAKFIFAFGSEKSTGFAQRVRFLQVPTGGYREFEVLEILEKYDNWAPLLDFECINGSKHKSGHSSQELWLCSGEEKAGAITHMRIGIRASRSKIHTSFKKITDFFPIHFSTPELRHNYYFLANAGLETKVYSYLEDTDEMLDVPFSTGIVTESSTIGAKLLKGAEAMVQVTNDQIRICNIQNNFRLKQSSSEILLADICENYVAYIAFSEHSNVFKLCYKYIDAAQVESDPEKIIHDLAQTPLSFEPTVIKLFEFADSMFIALGSTTGRLVFYKFETLVKTMTFFQELPLAVFFETGIHDVLAFNDNNDELWVYASDKLGSYSNFRLQIDCQKFIVWDTNGLNLGTLPITFELSEDKRHIFMMSKHLWRLNTKSPNSQPQTVFFDGVTNEKNVFAMASLQLSKLRKFAILREDGLCMSSLSEIPGGCPRTFSLGFTPNKFKYISYLHTFCLISNDLGTGNRLSFFDSKNFKKVKGKEVSKHNKELIFNKSERLLSISEWDIRKSNKRSVYKNVVVGCQYGATEGLVHVIELKREKNERDLIKVVNLYTWKTGGPVFALQQLHGHNVLIYSSGSSIYTRKYSSDKGTIEPPKKQFTCGSLVVSITMKESMVVVTTKSTSVAVFAYENDELVNTHNDQVSRYLLNGVGFDKNVIISDKLHFTVSGFKISSQKLVPFFKINTGTVGRVKKCSLFPVWFSDPELHQDNRFLVCGVGGEISGFLLVTEDELNTIAKSALKEDTNKDGIASKNLWDVNVVEQFHDSQPNWLLFDLDKYRMRSDIKARDLVQSLSL